MSNKRRNNRSSKKGAQEPKAKEEEVANNSKPSSNKGKDGGGKPQQRGKQAALSISAAQILTSANIGYGYPLGVHTPDFGSTKGAVDGGTADVPSIAVYWLKPAVTISRDNSSVLNMAAHELFTKFVYSNGRNPQYDVPDALIAPLAVGQVGMLYNFAVRAYRIMNTFSAMNRSVPRALYASLGLDYDDFKEHISDFAFWLDIYKRKLQTLFVPNDLPILTEWMSSMNDLYVDVPDNNKAQIYCFAPAHVLKYEPTHYTTGGALIPKDYLVLDGNGIPTKKTFAQFIAYADDILDALINDQDINRIMADIRLVFGPNSLQNLVEVNLGEPIAPEYDMTVLATIHNATQIGFGATPGKYAGHSTNSDSFEIFQDAAGNLIFDPYWVGPKEDVVGPIGSWRFDSPIVDPDPLLNIAMSRFTVLAEATDLASAPTLGSPSGIHFSNTVTAQVKPASCGCFIVYRVFITKAMKSAPGYAVLASDPVWWINSPDNIPVEVLLGIEKFDMHHIIPIYEHAGTDFSSVTSMGDLTFEGYFGDAYYYTLIISQNLEKIHFSYGLGLLNVTL